MLIIQVAFTSVKVALKLRDAGLESPCRWSYRSEIYTRMDTELHDPPADPQANRDLALFMLCQRYGLPMQKPELSDRQKALDAKALRGELETVRRLTSGCMAAVEKQLAHLRQAEKGDHDER